MGFSIAQVFTVIGTRNEYTGNILIFVSLQWSGSKVCHLLIKFSVSYTGTKVHISCNHEDEKSPKWDAADSSQLLIVTTNPNVPQSCKWEQKPFLSIPVPPPAPLGLHLWRLYKPFLLLFLMVNHLRAGWVASCWWQAASPKSSLWRDT